MDKEAHRSSEVVVGPSHNEASYVPGAPAINGGPSKQERQNKKNLTSSTIRKVGRPKKTPGQLGKSEKIPGSAKKLKKIQGPGGKIAKNTQSHSPKYLSNPKIIRKISAKKAAGISLDSVVEISPRQQFAIFKPPSPVIPLLPFLSKKMHPTQSEAEQVQPLEEQPILKVMVDKLVPENGLNGKEGPENIEPYVEDSTANGGSNGHNYNFEVEDEIVDVLAVVEEPLEADMIPEVQETVEVVTHEDNGFTPPDEPSSVPKLRTSSRLSTSSRSSSPADSVARERTARKLNYVQTNVVVEDKLEISMSASDLDDMEPLIAKGAAEDLEVSPSVPEPVLEMSFQLEKSPKAKREKSPRARTPVKVAPAPAPAVTSRGRKTPVKAPPVISPPEEEEEEEEEEVKVKSPARRGRRPKVEEEPKEPPRSPKLGRSARASTSLMEDEPGSRSAVASGSGIRSVRCRRIRRSRNISALDSSLHNQSSPWDEEYKILSPRGGGASLVDNSLVEDSPLSVSMTTKRKASSEDETDTKDSKRIKNESSHTSSFFSIVTSPIGALRERFRGGALSSSTPFHGTAADKKKTGFESDASMLSAEGIDGDNPIENKGQNIEAAAPEASGRSWCAIM